MANKGAAANFPEGIKFKEPSERPIDYKYEIFREYNPVANPEALKIGKRRGLTITEMLNKRI